MDKTNFWFMNINPGGGIKGYNHEDALCFCQKKNIIGLGWPVSEKVKDVEDAEKKLNNEKHPKNGIETVLKFLNKVNEDSYVWIYHKREHKYFLCKVTSSDWFNKPKSEIPWGKHDIGWYRKAEWKEIPLNLVPSPILRNPHMSTLCRINLTPNTKNYSVKLFKDEITFKNNIPNDKIKEVLKYEEADKVIDLLDPYDIEDIVCNYIQDSGWRLIKSTASKSLPCFEVIFRRSDKTQNVAYVQVKSGKQKISKKDLKLYKEKVKNEKALIFIFEQQDSKDKYPDLVKRITPKDIKKYILGHLPELSPETRFKLVID